MKCERVLSQLSLFLDGMLEDECASDVARHLRACADCDTQFARLKSLTDGLKGLTQVDAPEYLRSLVDARINNCRKESWQNSVRSALEYRWSRIRTTEGLWYWTRLTGVMATFVLFLAIFSGMSPLDLGFGGQVAGRGDMERPQQLGFGVLKNVGMEPVEFQMRPVSRPSDPKINDLYMVRFGENAMRNPHDDTVSVVAGVDSKGAGRVQGILEYPTDESLLSEFTDMIMSANWRPASRNGRAVDSQLVLIFSKVCVSN